MNITHLSVTAAQMKSGQNGSSTSWKPTDSRLLCAGKYQSLPRKIFPIFRDKTDLSSGVLWEQLKYQPEESEYLIVICSPRSARAEWVGQEITYFQELGRGKNIIPLIVDGEPHAATKRENAIIKPWRTILTGSFLESTSAS